MESKQKFTLSKNGKMILVVLGILAVVGAVSGRLVYDFLFPLPSNPPYFGQVTDVSLSYDGQELDVDDEEIANLLAHLQGAEPTRMQSVNDSPSTGTYYKVEMTSEEMGYCRIYVYEGANGDVLYEVPYGGIYETDQRALELLA